MPSAAAESLKNAGNALFKAGNYAGAVEKYKEAVKADPGNPAYWYVLFVCVCCAVLCCVYIYLHMDLTCILIFFPLLLNFATLLTLTHSL
jgi:tetratricopeptide (TPR) repeat protein